MLKPLELACQHVSLAFYILHSAFCIPRIISLSLAPLPLGVFALTAAFWMKSEICIQC